MMPGASDDAVRMDKYCKHRDNSSSNLWLWYVFPHHEQYMGRMHRPQTCSAAKIGGLQY